MTEFDKIFPLKVGLQTYNWGKVSSPAGPVVARTDLSALPGWAGQRGL